MLKLNAFPKALLKRENASLLTGILRGVERECLRASAAGEISQRAHPIALGSALTHPQITTDFSEALLEFITPPTHRVDDLLEYLRLIQRFAIEHMSDELLWSTSMPCNLQGDSNIPVARYGSSNNGKMKTIYRVGLGHRYGRSMQTVAGVHYNFSLPNAFWALLSSEENSILDLQQFIDERYFSLIRNFRRHYWLLIYLFGASPALNKSFVAGREHDLPTLEGTSDTLYLPYSTSLRMGDLGYQSSAQESLFVCYNKSATYIDTLCCAINRKHDNYEAIGLKHGGEYQQLNTSLLQIENEFYSAIRPKRSAQPGETALFALKNRGVEYIEVRCLDVDPFSPLGVSKGQIHFLDTFLLYCALQTSPSSGKDEFRKILSNQKKVVKEGRKPGLTLEHQELGEISLKEWASELIQAMSPLAQVLDDANGGSAYQEALALQQEKVSDPDKTPSARLLRELSEAKLEFNQYALALSQRNMEKQQQESLEAKHLDRMHQMAEESLTEQKAIEESPNIPFDEFLKNYYKQYAQCNKSKALKDGDCF